MLHVSRLSARRGDRDVLTGVSLTAHPSGILGVIGPNGAGKSTLFECIAGVLPRTSGEVRCDGELFYVPDGIRPWPEQTVRWTLDHHARVFGSERDERLVDALALRPLLDQRVGSLSKGEAKRVLIALGLEVPRQVLLLDEPFDGLDLRQTLHAMELLRSVAQEGRTLVVSIHQLIDAERLCDRFLLLNAGHAVAEGTLGELGGGTLEEVFLART